jgi:hypothetical protein
MACVKARITRGQNRCIQAFLTATTVNLKRLVAAHFDR